MPQDNAATVAAGADIQFPNDGPTTGFVYRSNASTFVLPEAGLYSVQFQASVTEAGQLCVAVNSVEQAYTVVGRATGATQIYGTCLVETDMDNSTLSIRNPAAASTALTITPNAGGPSPVSAHLVISYIQ